MLMIFDLAPLGSSKSKITTGTSPAATLRAVPTGAPGAPSRPSPSVGRHDRPLHRAVHLSCLGHL